MRIISQAKLLFLILISLALCIFVVAIITLQNSSNKNTKMPTESNEEADERVFLLDKNNQKYTLSGKEFEFSEIVKIEKITSVQTGSRSNPYRVLTDTVYKFQPNCLYACLNQSLECPSNQGLISHLNTEFKLSIKKAQVISRYERNTVDLYGTGLVLTLADRRQIFLAFTPLDLIALCDLSVDCFSSKVKGVVPYTEMGYADMSKVVLIPKVGFAEELVKIFSADYKNCHEFNLNTGNF